MGAYVALGEAVLPRQLGVGHHLVADREVGHGEVLLERDDVHVVTGQRREDLDVSAGVGHQPPRRGERGGREVEPDDLRPEPVQRQRVGADVALQVHRAQPADVAQARAVEGDDMAQLVLTGQQPLAVVARRVLVDTGPVVPVRAVHREVVVAHAASVPPAPTTGRS